MYIETIVMNNNYTGKETELAKTFDISFENYRSVFYADDNKTVISYYRH